MYQALLVLLLIIAIALIGLILLQQGKGASLGASFGAGASGTLFGASGSANFMTRATAVLAALFFIVSLVLGNLNTHRNGSGSSIWDNLVQPEKTAPAAESVAPQAPAEKTSDIPQ